jgi:hypothetical protein
MWPFHPRTASSADEDPRLTAARERAELTGYDGANRPFPPGEGYPNLPLYDGDTIVAFNPDQVAFGQAFIDETLAFIEANTAGPFFAYVPLSAPHAPLHPAEVFVSTSARGLYGDTVQEIDAGVGRILDRLVELGIDGNTLVIFLSDNGPWLEYGIDGGQAGQLADSKEGQFERGMRVPAMLRWAGVLEAGTTIDEPVSAVDIYPTLAGLSGAVVPARQLLDSVDVWSLLNGAVLSVSRAAIFSFNEADFTEIDLGAIISGDWKLHARTVNGSVRPVALYDLASDIAETTDVKASQAAVVSSLVSLGESIIADIAATQRPLGAVSRSGDPFTETDGIGNMIAIEAENFHEKERRVGHEWSVVSMRHNSFGASLQALPNGGINRRDSFETFSPSLVYRFVAEQAGRYFVWVRAQGAGADDDSLHVGVDGQPVTTGKHVANIFPAWTWTWTSARSDGGGVYIDVETAGEHVLNAWMREDGVIIDKFILTTDPVFQPAGKGLVESRQSYDTLSAPPVALDDVPFFVEEGDTLAGHPGVLDNDTDLRGDPVSAELVATPEHAAEFELRPDGTFNYRHNGSETSSDTFTYRALDVIGAPISPRRR